MNVLSVTIYVKPEHGERLLQELWKDANGSEPMRRGASCSTW
jgi:hypothetical protein